MIFAERFLKKETVQTNAYTTIYEKYIMSNCFHYSDINLCMFKLFDQSYHRNYNHFGFFLEVHRLGQKFSPLSLLQLCLNFQQARKNFY